MCICSWSRSGGTFGGISSAVRRRGLVHGYGVSSSSGGLNRGLLEIEEACEHRGHSEAQRESAEAQDRPQLTDLLGKPHECEDLEWLVVDAQWTF